MSDHPDHPHEVANVEQRTCHTGEPKDEAQPRGAGPWWGALGLAQAEKRQDCDDDDDGTDDVDDLVHG
jgi:hypothetical protein